VEEEPASQKHEMEVQRFCLEQERIEEDRALGTAQETEQRQNNEAGLRQQQQEEAHQRRLEEIWETEGMRKQEAGLKQHWKEEERQRCLEEVHKLLYYLLN
jgi:hypothetical protein